VQVRFLWRKVGSSGIKRLPLGPLTVEAFVNMSQLPLFPIGKSAIYLNHPNVTMQAWIDQDHLMIANGVRAGGPFFIHGNNPLTTHRSVETRPMDMNGHHIFVSQATVGCGPSALDGLTYTSGIWDEKLTGTCYHYMRARETAALHNSLWGSNAGVKRSASDNVKFRDVNDVTEIAVSRWRCEVRRVMAEVRNYTHTCDSPVYAAAAVLGDSVLTLRSLGEPATCELMREWLNITVNLRAVSITYARRAEWTEVVDWGKANATERTMWAGMRCDFELKRREVLLATAAADLADKSPWPDRADKCQALANRYGVVASPLQFRRTPPSDTIKEMWTLLNCSVSSQCLPFDTINSQETRLWKGFTGRE
jgi:hypothetical protein